MIFLSLEFDGQHAEDRQDEYARQQRCGIERLGGDEGRSGTRARPSRRSTGNTDTRKITATLDAMPIPNHRMNRGRAR